MSKKHLNLAICVPSGPEWSCHFGNSLVHMVCFLSQQIKGYDTQQFALYNTRSSILPRSRHELVLLSLKNDCTHALFIDSDQTFPHDLANRLLAHKKRVVACNIATKKIPSSPTARHRGSTDGGRVVFTTASSPPLEKVWRIGMGIMLIDLGIFKNPALAKPPWFDITYIPEHKSYRGEDWFFCERLEKAHVGIWIDHRVSLEVGHIGELEYEHSIVTKTADVA
jgi:hypothetical protein